MDRIQTQTVGQTTQNPQSPMGQTLTLCTICPHTGTACQVGHAMMAQLQKAISAAGDSIEEGFEISGYVEMGGCGRPCLLAYRGSRTTTHLFGDVREEEDIDALVAYATENRDALNRGAPATASDALSRRPAAVMAMSSGPALS